MTQAELVQIIKDNPGCVALVDNDCWTIYPKQPKPPEEMTDDDIDEWYDSALASDSDGFACSYGLGILYALAEIVGMEIELP